MRDVLIADKYLVNHDGMQFTFKVLKEGHEPTISIKEHKINGKIGKFRNYDNFISVNKYNTSVEGLLLSIAEYEIGSDDITDLDELKEVIIYLRDIGKQFKELINI